MREICTSGSTRGSGRRALLRKRRLSLSTLLVQKEKMEGMLWSVIDTTPGSAGKKESESTRRIGPFCPVWDSIKSLVTIPFRAPRFTPCDSSPIGRKLMKKEYAAYYANIAISCLYIILAILCGFYAWKEKLYRDYEEQLPNLLFAFGSLMAFLFSSEFASYQSYQGWSSRSWRHTPSGWIKFCGLVAFPYFAYQILTN